MSLKYCIIGHPLKHTMSPPIHQKLFEISGEKGEYTVCDVPPEELKAKAFREYINSINGYNVTIPYKVAIIPFLEKLHESARRYGAVNCVKTENGHTVGYNTDCIGFTRALKSTDLKLDGKILLLGCGGAGRMMAIETALNGGELTIVSRKESTKAQNVLHEIEYLAPKCKVTLTDYENIAGEFDLIINSTPVGMYPETDACPVSDEVLKNCKAAFDAIYNPKDTVLITKMKKMGKKALGGMSMLVWQAVVAHEIWYDAHYEDTDINNIISEMEKLVKDKFN